MATEKTKPNLRASISFTPEQMAKKAAQEIKTLLEKNPYAVLGLATGSTPIPLYEELIRMHKAHEIDLTKPTYFNLDEYVGLPVEHPESYHSYMDKHFFNHIPGLNRLKVNILDGNAPDKEAECRHFEEKIDAAGGIDLQILGIGENGHIGFSEPGTPFTERTHLVELTESTRQANSRFFDGKIERVPTHALTMGLATIMDARKVILLASGPKKAESTYKAASGEVTEDLPASTLRNHPDVTFYVDRRAASHYPEYVKLFSSPEAVLR